MRADASAKIRPRIFLEGNFFVDLAPGSAGAQELDEGATIPASRTTTPVQFDQVLSALKSDTRNDLRQVFTEVGTAQDAGGAQAFNDSLRYQPAAYKFTAVVSKALLGLAARRPRRLGPRPGRRVRRDRRRSRAPARARLGLQRDGGSARRPRGRAHDGRRRAAAHAARRPADARRAERRVPGHPPLRAGRAAGHPLARPDGRRHAAARQAAARPRLRAGAARARAQAAQRDAAAGARGEDGARRCCRSCACCRAARTRCSCRSATTRSRTRRSPPPDRSTRISRSSCRASPARAARSTPTGRGSRSSAAAARRR